MRPTPNADLVLYARRHGIHLSEFGARKMRAARGDEGARERIDAIAALIDLASAFGFDLSRVGAVRRLDAHNGDYDAAADRLIAIIRERRQGVFVLEWGRMEKAYYAKEARARHAALLGDLARGTLGVRTILLLAAADDAELARPDAKKYRAKLTKIVGDEIDRRYPNRREAEWRVSEEGSEHIVLVEKQMSQERQARDLVLNRTPELHQRIDALSDGPRLHRDVEAITDEIGERLQERVEAGWIPSPERYRSKVIELAVEASRAVRAA